jgi:hypothetical protein
MAFVQTAIGAIGSVLDHNSTGFVSALSDFAFTLIKRVTS